MPRTKEQFHAMQEESRAAIVNAALELFAVHSFNGTTITMIAKHAGVSQGLMYNYFKSKEELLAAVIEHGMEDVQASFVIPPKTSAKKNTKKTAKKTTKHNAQQPAPPTLADFVRNVLRIVKQHEHLWRLIYAMRFQPAVLTAASARIADVEALIIKQLEQFCTHTKNPTAHAWLLFALVDGVAIHSVTHGTEYPIDGILSALEEHPLFTLIAKPPKQ